MKKSLLILPLLVATAVCAHASDLKAGAIAWAKGYSAAKANSASSGKLMMIDFYTDWCGWCKKLDSDTYPAATVVKASEEFVPIKLNAEKDADGIRLAKKFKIDGYPTILFIDGNENLVYKVVGYQEAPQFTESMKRAASLPKDLKMYHEALAKDPNDVKALLGLCTVDASVGQTADAVALLTKAEPMVKADNKGQLLEAYNAVGDSYQNDNKIDTAIPYFMKGIDPAFPKQSAYARISLAVCYLQSGKNADAKADLDELQKLGPAADQYKNEIKQMLDYLSKQK